MSTHNDQLIIKQFVPKPRQGADGASSNKRQRPRVSDHQRKRVKAACRECRLDKVRCVGGVPCRRCIARSISCETQDSLVREAKPLSPYERLELQETILKRMLGVSTISDQDLLRLSKDPKTTTPQEMPSPPPSEQAATENSTLCSSTLGMESLSGFTRKLQTCIGDTEDIGAEASMERLCRSPSPEHGLLHGVAVNLAEQLPPHRIGEHLVHTFLQYVQCNSFCVHEAWTVQTLELCYADQRASEKVDISRIATLLMLMALGSQFVGLQDPPAELPCGEEAKSLEDIGHACYKTVLSLLPHLIELNSFESVRCVMLLAVYLFPHDLAGRGYSLLGLALHMALRRGMHRHQPHTADHSDGPDRLQAEVECRVWWTLYTYYQRACIFQGCPLTLTHESVSTIRPQLLQDLEPIHGETNFANQIALIDITLMLEKITGALIEPHSNGSARLPKLLSLRHGAIELRESLPKIGEQASGGEDIHRLRLDIHVNLFYWHTHLSLGRLVLLRPANEAVQPTSQAEPGQELLAQNSIHAAQTMIDLCEIIHKRIGLAPASYATEFTSCRAAMLVLIAATFSSTNESHQMYLDKGMHLVDSLSSSYSQASKEAREIIALEKAVAAFGAKSRAIPAEIAAANTPYEGFHNPWIGGETPAVTAEDASGAHYNGSDGSIDQLALPERLGLDDDWNDMWNNFLHSGAF